MNNQKYIYYMPVLYTNEHYLFAKEWAQLLQLEGFESKNHKPLTNLVSAYFSNIENNEVKQLYYPTKNGLARVYKYGDLYFTCLLKRLNNLLQQNINEIQINNKKYNFFIKK